MSRCFPFPPPGYEKKTGNDPIDLLTKEKRTEKKHKKEDKERKDKKDKERSKDKLRDKKDRKEKHKEKDKKKDKNKDKDKNKILDDRKIKERTESHGGAKIAETSQQNEELKNSKLLEELGRRIRNGGAAGSQKLKNCVGADQRTEASHPPLEKTRDKEGDVRRQQRQRESEEGRVFGNEMVQNFGGPDKGRYGGFGISVEKSMDKRAEGKEKNKDKEGGERRKGKHKDRDREKRKKEKDRDKDKEKEKDWDKDKEKEKDCEKDKEKEKEKLKQKGEDKEDKECKKLGESNKKGQINTVSSIQPLSIVSNKSGGNEGNLKKRKEFEMNGFIHENDIRPNKLLRPLSSSHLPVENGKNCHVAILSAPERQGAPDSNTETNKEHKVNGVVEVPHSSIKLKASREACENGESSSAKHPHPDSKYLSQIYSIPKVEEWSAFGEEQEWLFDGERCLQSKPKVGPEASKTIPQVWAEALQIESADICAFPYVIPY